MVPCEWVGELVDESQLILVTLSTYEAAREVLGEVSSFAEKTVAVLSTGVPSDAERMAEAVEQEGGH